MKKLTLTFASLVALSACASNGDIDGSVSGSMGMDTQMAVMEDRPVDPATRELRDQLKSEAGDRIYFDFDSASLSADAQTSLKDIAAFILDTNKVMSVMVEGHCDERGTREYNLALGDRRAVAVKKYLVGLGVSASKITTISYGKERPADMSHNEKAWAKNRRSVIVLN